MTDTMTPNEIQAVCVITLALRFLAYGPIYLLYPESQPSATVEPLKSNLLKSENINILDAVTIKLYGTVRRNYCSIVLK